MKTIWTCLSTNRWNIPTIHKTILKWTTCSYNVVFFTKFMKEYLMKILWYRIRYQIIGILQQLRKMQEKGFFFSFCITNKSLEYSNNFNALNRKNRSLQISLTWSDCSSKAEILPPKQGILMLTFQWCFFQVLIFHLSTISKYTFWVRKREFRVDSLFILYSLYCNPVR